MSIVSRDLSHNFICSYLSKHLYFKLEFCIVYYLDFKFHTLNTLNQGKKGFLTGVDLVMARGNIF